MQCTNCNSSKTKRLGCKNNGTCHSNRCNKFSVFDWLGDIKPDSNKKLCLIIELSFKNGRKQYYSNNNNLTIKVGDPVVVKCEIGYDIGIVSLTGELIRLQLKRKQINVDDIHNVFKIPTQKDLDIWQKAISLEKSTMLETRQIVQNLDLEMKITDVEYQADGKRAIFYYLANQRIDFRELIKILSQKFNIKTLMRVDVVFKLYNSISYAGKCTLF